MPPGFRGIHADVGVDVMAPPDSLVPAVQGRRPVAQEVLGRLEPGVSFEQAAAQFDAMWPALLEQAKAMNQGAAEGQTFSDQSSASTRWAGASHPPRAIFSGRHDHPRPRRAAAPARLRQPWRVVADTAECTQHRARRAPRPGRRTGADRAADARREPALSGAGTLWPFPSRSRFSPRFQRSSIRDSWVGDLVHTGSPRVGRDGRHCLSSVCSLTALPVWFAMRRQATVRFTWDGTLAGATGRWTTGLLWCRSHSRSCWYGAALLARSLFASSARSRCANGRHAHGTAVGRARRQSRHEPGRALPAAHREIRAIPGVTPGGASIVFPRRLTLIGSDVGLVGEEFTGVRTSLDSVSPNSSSRWAFVWWPAACHGRRHTESRRVVVLSESLARALAPDGNILDQRLKVQTNRAIQDLLVIGVVGNSTQGDLKNAKAHVIFSPAAQSAGFNSANLCWTLRLIPDADCGFAPPRRSSRTGASSSQTLPCLTITGSTVRRRERMSAILAAMISILAVLLALIGLHGVLGVFGFEPHAPDRCAMAIGANPAIVRGHS